MNYNWHWGVFFTEAIPGQTYLSWLLSGLGLTVSMGLCAWAIGLVLGSIVGVMRTAPNRWLAMFAAAYVEIFRNIPLLAQLFIWYFVVPELLPQAAHAWVVHLQPQPQQMLAGVLCLGMYTSARLAVQVSAGITSLPGGQRNAGLALGFTLVQTYRYVLLPMTFRIIIPPLTSEFMTVFKNSAVMSMIGMLELTAQGQQLVDYTSQPYESFTAVTMLYLLINMTALYVMRWIEKRVQIPGLVMGRR
ncbi:amino acid ABC transporter permease [Glaciimonas soli]|uniref:ABC transporter permease subunit n=1 Tax=Glaciimonas soli TaxID=2590999 RepID=A0A843YWK4_9BURK|nr:amino acid ABC transporter permease [Glaciimonas soli]MQR02073.1 ABC transporter permease subunit [Glaciimonas soli]